MRSGSQAFFATAPLRRAAPVFLAAFFIPACFHHSEDKPPTP